LGGFRRHLHISLCILLVRDKLTAQWELLNCTAPSQQPDSNEGSGQAISSALHRGLKDQKAIYLAPFRRKNVRWDLLFARGTGALIASDRYISSAVPLGGVNASQLFSNIGLYSTVAVSSGIGVFGTRNADPHALETGVLSLESIANTGVLLALTQVAAGRERPTQGKGDGRFWRNNTVDSLFFSAHSSFTWTMSTVIEHEYPKPWVRWLAYGTASAVSTTRVTGLKHFPADVAVGGVIGYLIGQQMFRAHCSPGLSPACRRAPRNGSTKDWATIQPGQDSK
jgi:membrane-associated phospholipid phosphatase